MIVRTLLYTPTCRRPLPCGRGSRSAFCRFIVISLSAILVASRGSSVFAQEKVTYQDHVLPIFRSACLSCHNPEKKKAGLDLASFAGVLAGSSGGKVVETGDPDGSTLYRVMMQTDEPKMPPKGGKLPDKDLATIKAWIAGGLLETSGSAAVASNRAKVDLSVSTAALGKPDGPPPMPGELPRETLAHTARPGAPSALAASPWAPLVALGGQRQILLYEPSERKLLGILPFPEGSPFVLRFSRNGKLLLAAGGEGARKGKAVLFDVASGKRMTDVGDEVDSVIAADLSADQSRVALGGTDKVVKIFSTSSGALLAKIRKHTDWITAIAYSPDNVLLATGDRAGNLYVWEAGSGNLFYTLDGHKGAITSLRFRTDSNVLASASEDGTFKLWDMGGGGQIKSVNAHGPGVASIDFAADGRLTTCGRDKLVKFWAPDGNGKGESQPFDDIALQVAFTSDAKSVVAGGWSGQVRVIAVQDGKSAGTLDLNPPPLPDRLASAGQALDALQSQTQSADAELRQRQQEAQAAAAALTLARQKADAAVAEMSRAKAQVNDLKLAVAFNAIYRARTEVESLEPRVAAAKQALAAVQGQASANLKEIQALDKQMSDGPSQIEKLQQAVTAATQQVASARAAEERVAKQLAERQPAAVRAGETAKQLAEVAAKSPDDRALAQAAEQATAASRTLDGAVAEAKEGAKSAASQSEAAAKALAGEQSSLAQVQAGLAAAPAMRKKLQEQADKLAAESAKARADVEGSTANLAKAQQALKDSQSQYDAMKQSLQAPASPAASASPAAVSAKQ